MSGQSSLRQRGVYETGAIEVLDSESLKAKHYVAYALLKYILLQYQVVTRALVQLIQAPCFAQFPLPCRL